MKKTLVAIAALAVVGAASAQSTVNLTGKLAYGYEAAKTAAGVKTNGLRVTDGDFVLTAVEDLGGGLKAQASMAVLSRGRGTAISGRDASVSLMGGFGTVIIGSVESGNGILPYGGAGAPVIGLDGNVVLSGGVNVDLLGYSTPSMGGFTGILQMSDSINAAVGTFNGGMESAAITTDAVLVGANYSNGPINARIDYTSFGANTAPAASPDNRFRISGNYNLGVAVIGAGYQTQETIAGVESKDLLLGVSVPFGPVTLGAVYARRKTDGLAANTGFDLGVEYALSRRTNIRTMYQSIDSNAANKATTFRVRLLHSF